MDWVYDIVVGLIEHFETSNVYDLFNLLDIKIEKVEKDNPILKGNKGFYFRYMDDIEVVFIRNDLEENEEEFILLHELGHALCNSDVTCVAFKYGNIGKYEQQANYFAFSLLIKNKNLDKHSLNLFSIEQIMITLDIPFCCENFLIDYINKFILEGDTIGKQNKL